MNELSYRIVCHEIDGDTETIILDTTVRAFILVTGTPDEHGTMRGNAINAGPRDLRRRLAQMIAENELSN